MCGRYNINESKGLRALFDDLGIQPDLPLARYNIAPTEDILLIHSGKAELARWWLVPSWSKEVSTKYSMFNARCESLSKSPAFKKPFRSQRGIVPMSSFLEWRTEAGDKRPWLITNADSALAVAALWDVWEGGESPLLSCTVVTTEAAPEFMPWHNRMPVMLDREEAHRWLNEDQAIEQDDPLFRPELKYPLYLFPLNKAVGNARNKDGQLMAPAGATIELCPDGTA